MADFTSNSSPAIVVIGGANYDYLARGAKLPKAGETVTGDLVDEAPGGKGANQAVAAARLGGRVTFIGRIGSDDRGERVLAALHQEQIDTTHIVRDPTEPTGVALIQVNERGEKQILAIPGANARLTAEDVRSAKTVIEQAAVVLLQLEIPLDAVVAAARIARETGVTVVLDPAPPVPVPDELLGLVYAIKPNSAEAHALTSIEVKDRETAAKAAAQLLARGVGAVSIATGDGTLAVWRGGERWLPRLPVKCVDATGAGDAYAAGLAVALAGAKGGTAFAEATAFANATAALATTVVGAQAGMPSRDAVIALLKINSPETAA